MDDTLKRELGDLFGPFIEAVERQTDALGHAFTATADQIDQLWKDNAAIRDDLHALANRVETLTRARLAEPIEVADKILRQQEDDGA